MTPVGYLFIGIVVEVTGGLIWGVVRERKGKNKKYIFWGPKLEKKEEKENAKKNI